MPSTIPCYPTKGGEEETRKEEKKLCATALLFTPGLCNCWLALQVSLLRGTLALCCNTQCSISKQFRLSSVCVLFCNCTDLFIMYLLKIITTYFVLIYLKVSGSWKCERCFCLRKKANKQNKICLYFNYFWNENNKCQITNWTAVVVSVCLDWRWWKNLMWVGK